MSIFDYTFTDGAGNTGALVLGMPATFISGPGQVSNVSGTFDGVAITGLSNSASNYIFIQGSSISYSGSDNLAFTLANGSTVGLGDFLGVQGVLVQTSSGSVSLGAFASQSVSMVSSQVKLNLTDSSGTTGNLSLTVSGGYITAISGTYGGSAVTGFNGQLSGAWMVQYPFYASTSAMAVSFNLANGNSEVIFESQGINSVITGVNNGSYIQQYNYTITSDTATTLCFCAGTRIATPAGEVRVETLRAGDLVLTATGEAKPVRWLGRSDVSATFADSLRSAPIRIAAGALAENLPMRDLRVSPAHAVFLNGILVQAAALVNGVTIVRERLIHDFSYYHVELESHELLISEGLATESFVDNIDRMAFSNWDERATPVTPIAEMPYPRAKSTRQLPRALREVLTQGLAMTA